MNRPGTEERIAVCSWSLQPIDSVDLIEKVQATGIHRIQLAIDPLRQTPSAWGGVGTMLRQAGIRIVSAMFGCIGEDYTSLESIRRTGGLAPDSTWPGNLERIRFTAQLAARLELKRVTFHAGFIPHDTSAPEFGCMVDRLRQAADLFAAEQLELALETGQETASALISVLQTLSRTNVGVNFDPANMILYDKGNPVEAARQLAPWIRQVHIKDARRTRTPGTWGEEVVAGTGEVDWPGFFRVLKDANYAGDFVIEREAGSQRVEDVRTARDLILRYAA